MKKASQQKQKKKGTNKPEGTNKPGTFSSEQSYRKDVKIVSRLLIRLNELDLLKYENWTSYVRMHLKIATAAILTYTV